jgi:hypothetical protein
MDQKPMSSVNMFRQSCTIVRADLIAQVEHFFVYYNEAKGKRFEVKGRSGKKRALALVKDAMTGRGADDGYRFGFHHRRAYRRASVA